MLFPSLRKSRLFIDFFLVREFLDNHSTFSLVGNGKFYRLFPSFFFPTSPSSIQKPPCSVNLLRTVFAVTPRYSDNSFTVTRPSILQASKAVSMLLVLSFFRSDEVFLLLKFLLKGEFFELKSLSGFMSSSTPVSSIRCTG